MHAPVLLAVPNRGENGFRKVKIFSTFPMVVKLFVIRHVLRKFFIASSLVIYNK